MSSGKDATGSEAFYLVRRRAGNLVALCCTAVYQLKVQLKGARPPIWRRLLVPGDTTLDRLHELIQAAMGWEDSHLHAFWIRGVEYGPPSEGDFLGGSAGRDEGRSRLGEVAAPKAKIRYVYDFGDDWEHAITVEKVLAPEPDRRYPAVVAGEGACPPEDSGGLWGYYEKLEALKDPEHPDHEDVIEWMGPNFDPARFDLAEADAAVASVAGRRRR